MKMKNWGKTTKIKKIEQEKYVSTTCKLIASHYFFQMPLKFMSNSKARYNKFSCTSFVFLEMIG